MKKGPKWVPDGSVWRTNKVKMLIRTFPDDLGTIFFLSKSWSPEALDRVWETTDDRFIHPRRPWTHLEQSWKSKFSTIFSTSRTVYDDRLWLSSMIIVYDHRLWSSSIIIVHHHRPSSSSIIIIIIIIIYHHRHLSSIIIIVYHHRLWGIMIVVEA